MAKGKARGARLGNTNGAAALLDGCRAATAASAAASAAVRRARAAQHAAGVPVALGAHDVLDTHGNIDLYTNREVSAISASHTRGAGGSNGNTQ